MSDNDSIIQKMSLDEILLYSGEISVKGSYQHSLIAGSILEEWVNLNTDSDLEVVISKLLNNSRVEMELDFVEFINSKVDDIHNIVINKNKGEEIDNEDFIKLEDEWLKMGRSAWKDIYYPSLSIFLNNFYIENKNVFNAEMDKVELKPLEYFGMNDFVKKYLRRVRGHIVTNRKQLYMIIALGINYVSKNVEDTIECFRLLCENKIVFGSPILFNSGKNKPQLSSCFLFNIGDDLGDILSVTKDFGLISKACGGIGFSCTGVRAEGQAIGCDDHTNGVSGMLKVYNSVLNYTKNKKRSSAYSCFLEPWHSDFMKWLDLKLNTGDDKLRARELFYGIWNNDLLMERIDRNSNWSFFSPDDCPLLLESYGDEFKKNYEEYEKQGKALKTINAKELWRHLCLISVKTGGPYIMYKDACNRKSNQKNLGVIKGSNLCTEIVEYSDDKEVAVCNIGTIALAAYVNDGEIDYKGIQHAAGFLCRMLNKIIDINHYPIERAKVSNMKHRPLGIGTQSMADLLMKIRLPYTDPKVDTIYAKIFEHIYFGALSESHRLALRDGAYESFKGSPLSQGKFQFTMWKDEHENTDINKFPEDLHHIFNSKFIFDEDSSELDWSSLRRMIMKYGVRNSLLTTQPPTQSCGVMSNRIQTTEGILSYDEICKRGGMDLSTLSPKAWYKLPKPITVMTKTGNRECNKIFHNGKVRTKKLTLADGKTYTFSLNHMLNVAGKGWTYVDHLESGDTLL